MPVKKEVVQETATILSVSASGDAGVSPAPGFLSGLPLLSSAFPRLLIKSIKAAQGCLITCPVYVTLMCLEMI